MYACVCVYVHVCMHVCVCTCTCVCICLCVYPCIRHGVITIPPCIFLIPDISDVPKLMVKHFQLPEILVVTLLYNNQPCTVGGVKVISYYVLLVHMLVCYNEPCMLRSVDSI